MRNKIVIVIPTYNAKESILHTIKKIFLLVKNAQVIIVDDNSPDKTASLVKSHFGKDKRVILVNRKEKGGRGSAVIAGLKVGFKNKEAQYFIEMDADLCHDPKYIAKLVDKCRKADVVIASRYLPQSRIDGWTWKRKLMSFAINTFAKIILQIPINDYTDGFRCYSRKAVAIICSYEIKSRGYIVLSEIAYLCFRKKLRFAEVPINFYFKPVTKSNLNLKEVREALTTIIRLPFQNYETETN